MFTGVTEDTPVLRERGKQCGRATGAGSHMRTAAANGAANGGWTAAGGTGEERGAPAAN